MGELAAVVLADTASWSVYGFGGGGGGRAVVVCVSREYFAKSGTGNLFYRLGEDKGCALVCMHCALLL